MDEGTANLRRFDTKVVNYLWHLSCGDFSQNHGDISLDG
jgi:hypothetical protein